MSEVRPSPLIAAVVPCYNEVPRLDLDAFSAAIVERAEWRFLLVDDGSTDATAERLDRLASCRSDGVTVLRLPRNVGKGEAVRRGMLAALDLGADIVAYTDADLSTPLGELHRLVDRARSDERVDVVLGARVRRLGADIRRSELRHVVGRLYATVASLALGVGVYDTQCGAKAFRRTARLEQALAQPFDERWSFDVELLSRLTRGEGLHAWAAIVEEPLLVWHTRAGSKLRLREGMRAAAELARIGYRHRRAR